MDLDRFSPSNPNFFPPHREVSGKNSAAHKPEAFFGDRVGKFFMDHFFA